MLTTETINDDVFGETWQSLPDEGISLRDFCKSKPYVRKIGPDASIDEVNPYFDVAWNNTPQSEIRGISLYD